MSKAGPPGPRFAEALALLQRGQPANAQAILRDILRTEPRQFDALYLLGVSEAQAGRLAEAETLIQRALAVNPKSPNAHSDLGNVLSGLGRQQDAIASYDRAIALKPDFAEAHLNRGNALMKLARHAEALASYERAISLKPALADAHANRGIALLSLRQFESALASIDRVLAAAPNHPLGLAYRAEALRGLRRHEEAIACCDRALAGQANLAGAWITRGKCLHALERHEEAVASYRRALAIHPDLAEAWYGCGVASFALKRPADAAAAYDRVLAIAEMDYARGLRLHARMHACDWSGFDDECAQVLAAVRKGERAAAPFVLLPIAATAADQLRCAELHTAHAYPPGEPLWRGERYAHERIRIAYVSTDLCEHAVGHLVAGLFEHHDKARFETVAMSVGPDQDVEVRRRIRTAFEHFIDARSWTDERIAHELRAREIDIAIDLNGHTGDARTGVFARRVAPVQVNYLGCPATMGAPYMDYIVADRTLIPEDQQQFYAEQVVYLPHSYQANDSKRPIAEHTPSRVEAGLPADGFVFCSFNNTFKITPDLFGVWMRLLTEVEGSVLWLFEGNTTAPENLRRGAQARGVDPQRLIFAPRTTMPEHLARHRLADLCLDTLYYNGHTTGSDALWAGVPFVTLPGATFASRVGASLLKAVGLDDLIVASLEEYQALALRLARDPAALAAIKDRLARNRAIAPLFDTARYAQHLESAFTTMWERHQRGEKPASFAVPD